MPEEEIELSTSDEKGWLGKIKESIYQNWQTILVALIVLVVGISAYNYNEQTGKAPSEAVSQEEKAEEAKAEETPAEATTGNQEEQVEQADQQAAQGENATQQTETTAPQPTEETKTEETNTNKVESNDDGYKVAAVKGEGITHLARKALGQYLSENSDSEVTALHKIYIEDYLQNKIGSQEIEVGHAESFSKQSIQEAITASKKLSQASLENLRKYSVQ